MASKQNNTTVMTQKQLDQVDGGLGSFRALTMGTRGKQAGKALAAGPRILKSRIVRPRLGSMLVVVPN